MQVVINIPKEKYNVIKSDLYNTFPGEMKEWGLEAIRNGTPLSSEGISRVHAIRKWIHNPKANQGKRG